MSAMIKRVFYGKVIRLFVYILPGLIFLLLMQQTALITPRHAFYEADDSVQDKEDEIAISSTTLTKSIKDESTTKKIQQSLQSTPKAKVSYADDTTLNRLGAYCSDKTNWSKKLSVRLGRLTTDMKKWDFECPSVNISKIVFQKPRPKLSLNCKQNKSSYVKVTQADDNSDIHVAPFGDACVSRYIQECCKGKFRVPNVVHYVWYMRGELTFVGFTSMLSVIRFVAPCFIILHGDKLPYGTYWNFLVNISPNIIHLKRDPPEFVSGIQIKYKAHSSDVMRIEALLHYGGIYMDTDTVIVKPLEPLRDFSCVMSNQSSGLMGSAFVMAEKNAKFLQLWMDGYRFHYKSSKYAYNAMVYPKLVAREHKDFIHIEYGTISRPIKMTGMKIFSSEYATYNWSNIYGIHIYSRLFKKPLNEYTIKNMTTIVGSICRHVIFGNKELCN